MLVRAKEDREVTKGERRIGRAAGDIGDGLNCFVFFVLVLHDPRFFAGRSIGYRLAFAWGPKKDDPLITAGTDLNAFGNQLVENIRFQQYQGPNLNTGLPVPPGQPANFFQIQRVPPSNVVNPGLFVEAKLPATDRLKVRTGVKAGGVWFNHNQGGLAVKSKVKAGWRADQHNQTAASGLKVRTVTR